MDDSAAWPHDALLHAWWVEPGRPLAGEYPSSETPERAAKKVRLLVEAGIGSIVDLTIPADGLDSYRESLQAAAAEAGREIRHFSFPIPDNDVIDRDGYDRIVACIRDEIDSGRVVYLHCWGGKGRTSTVVGCLLIDSGLDYDAAIARIAELRAGTRKALDACPESVSQHRVCFNNARPDITIDVCTSCRSNRPVSYSIRACRAMAECRTTWGVRTTHVGCAQPRRRDIWDDCPIHATVDANSPERGED